MIIYVTDEKGTTTRLKVSCVVVEVNPNSVLIEDCNDCITITNSNYNIRAKTFSINISIPKS